MPSDSSDAAVIASSFVEAAQFGEIFDRHYAEINRYLARRIGSSLADELAAETFVVRRACRARGRASGNCSFRAGKCRSTALPKEGRMNDLELVREFRSRVDGPDDQRDAAVRARLLAQYADAPGRGRLPRPVHRPNRLRSWPAFAGLLAAPVLTAIAVVLIAGALGGSGSSAADAAIIRHVVAVFSPPPDRILHTEVVGIQQGVAAESWQLTSPPYSFLGAKGTLGAMHEEAANATTASYYDPTTDTIHEQPTGAPPAFVDPLTEVREALDDGHARVIGTAEAEGVQTYRIQLADKHGFTAQNLVAYVDQRTYRPLVLADPQSDGTIVNLRVAKLEYLPATAANLRLLSLAARHPSARVVTDRAAKSSTPDK